MPVGHEPIVNDSLSGPGAWTATSRGKGQCRFQDSSLVAERTDKVEDAEYRCTGPTPAITDDFVLTVSTTLHQDGSCAGIWFHDVGRTSQMLQICPDGLSLRAETSSGIETLGTFTGARPITPGQKVAIRLAVQGRKVSVWQDQVAAGSVSLGGDNESVSGQVQLGISVENGDALPPFSVSFADVDIRTL